MAKEFKPPAKSSTLERQAKAADITLPPVIKVGTLVIFSDGDQLVLGWVIQNSMSAGGQTGSYVVVDGSLDHDTVKTWPKPRRIEHSQVMQTVDIELP